MLDKEAMKQLCIRIPIPMWEKMQKFCKKHGMTQSEFIRYAIAQILDRPTNN